eukprot:COSAG02_NODE_8348_length_2603_cov_1.472843_3_plen_32_part_00
MYLGIVFYAYDRRMLNGSAVPQATFELDPVS